MKKAVLTLFICLPVLLSAQNENDTHWISGLSWAEIRQIASKENKYIFVDCFATWCKPCKVMDKDVYPNDSVQNFLNRNFISVRAQMDTSKNDGAETKKWYADASRIQQVYSINIYPSFLFFSPDGMVVHKAVGSKNVKEFLDLASDALDTCKQYYKLVESFNRGTIKIAQLPYLARTAKLLDEKKLATKVADKYKVQYLDTLSLESFLNKNVISFIADFPESSKSTQRLVKLCQQRPKTIDSIMFPGFANSVINFIIDENFIYPYLTGEENERPDWDKMFYNIDAEFGKDYATTNLLKAKMDYYKTRQNWTLYVKALIQKVEMKPLNRYDSISSAFDLNNYAWEVFTYSSDNNQLKKALEWSDRSINLAKLLATSLVSGNMDTKANLLYKLGKRKEAIEAEEEAIKLAVNNEELRSALLDNLNKMKAGKPTWSVSAK